MKYFIAIIWIAVITAVLFNVFLSISLLRADSAYIEWIYDLTGAMGSEDTLDIIIISEFLFAFIIASISAIIPISIYKKLLGKGT